ncbi:hypothetical protein PVAG01_10016 [Phlyctema vagabunda]|uniref:Extracellular mutant protein 11 C-terminal domain-containing protein n=1 Tax=Phlyctema vagabunda TaxID=108571 RepID=A0ABR4P4R7_9HELO
MRRGLQNFVGAKGQTNNASDIQKKDRASAAALKFPGPSSATGPSNLSSDRRNLTPTQENFPRQNHPQSYGSNPAYGHNSPRRGLGDSSVASDFDDTLTSLGPEDMSGEEYGEDHAETHRVERQKSNIPVRGLNNMAIHTGPETMYDAYREEQRTSSRTSGRFQGSETVNIQPQKPYPGPGGGTVPLQSAGGSRKRSHDAAVNVDQPDGQPKQAAQQQRGFIEPYPDEDQDSDISEDDDDTQNPTPQIGNPSSSQKGPEVGPDYDDETLRKMKYSTLRKESFDTSPNENRSPTPDAIELDTFDKKMEHFLKLVKESETQTANSFVQDMKVDEWEQTGDWLLAEIGTMFQKRKQARHEQRKINAKLEKELDRRYRDVDAEMRDLEKELDSMQAGAQKLIPGKSPMKR